MVDDPKGIEVFSEFRRSFSSLQYTDLLAKPGTKVESADAFDEMRVYLQHLYEGVDARHSFVDCRGLIVDCIPFEQHPAVRNSSPSLPPLDELATSANEEASEGEPPQFHPDYKDKFGNQMFCPEGTVPMVRVTLDQMSQFRTLHDFLRPADIERLPGQAALLEAESSQYSARGYFGYFAAAYQDVPNRGGRALLSANRRPFPASSGIWCLTPGGFVFFGWQARFVEVPHSYPPKYRLLPCLLAWCQIGSKLYDIEKLGNHYVPLENRSGRLGGSWEPPTVEMGILNHERIGWVFVVNRAAIGYLKASFFPAEECTAVQFGGYTNPTGWGQGNQKNIQYFANSCWHDCHLDHRKMENPAFNKISFDNSSAEGTRIDFGSP